MKVKKILFREVSIPFNFQFSQSNNPCSERSSSAILELHLEDGTIGYGEACPRLYVTGENMESMQKDLKGIAPQFSEIEVVDIEGWKKQLENWKAVGVGPSTLCALELAALDAISIKEQKPIAALLNMENDHTPMFYSQILPMLQPEKMAKLLPRISHLKPASIKLKANNKIENNLKNIGLIRECFGPNIPIRVDVNTGWTLSQALDFIPAFLKLGVNSFEQPLPADHLDGIRQLTQTFGREVSIMVDESLLSFKGAQHILEHGISNHFNLKVSKLGGIFRTLAIYQLASEYGVPCQLGAHFGETSLLTAAGVLLTKMAGPMTANEGALGEILLEKDITTPSLTLAADGQLDPGLVLQKIGLSHALNVERLTQYTINCNGFQPYKFNKVMKRLMTQ